MLISYIFMFYVSTFCSEILKSCMWICAIDILSTLVYIMVLKLYVLLKSPRMFVKIQTLGLNPQNF